MQEPSPALSRRTFVGGATALAAASLAFPQAAFAVTAAEKQAEADAVRNQLVGLNADLEAAAERYYGALDEQNAARTAMEAEQVKIDEATAQIERKIRKNKTRLAKNLRAEAVLPELPEEFEAHEEGSATFLDFLMGATSFAEFTQNWDILNGLNENDTQMVAETKTLRETVEASKAEYAKQEKIAADKAAEAKAIKEEVEAKIAQADALMNSLDAEARALLEEEQRAAAEAAAAQKQAEMEAEAAREAANSGNAGGGGDGGTGGGNPPSGGGGNGVDIPSQGSVVDYAMSRIGCPYEWGAEGPNSFDCSGLVTWAYRQIGMYVPHQSESQYSAARQRVPVSEARPGDVLWRYGHVGIAVSYGGTHYVHAPDRGLLVRDTDPLSWSKFTCALRF